MTFAQVTHDLDPTIGVWVKQAGVDRDVGQTGRTTNENAELSAFPTAATVYALTKRKPIKTPSVDEAAA